MKGLLLLENLNQKLVIKKNGTITNTAVTLIIIENSRNKNDVIKIKIKIKFIITGDNFSLSNTEHKNITFQYYLKIKFHSLDNQSKY